MNRFDPVLHKYYIDDVEVPSITQVLKEVGAVNDFWYDSRGRERGVSVHEVCRKIACGEDNAQADLGQEGYIEAFRDFLHETGFKPDSAWCEKPLFSREHMFGGTPDLVGRIKYFDGPLTVIDIKTGDPGYATKFQVAAQAILLNAVWDRPIKWRRFSLRLRESGVFKVERDVIEYADDNDYPLFVGALNLIHDRRAYEKQKKEEK